MKRLLNLILLFSFLQCLNGQELADSYKLNIGTNRSGLADWLFQSTLWPRFAIVAYSFFLLCICIAWLRR